MKSPILFYDGYCALCNFFVKLIIRFDPNQRFYFSALQSELGQTIRKQYNIAYNIDSIILYSSGKIYTYHHAAFEILRMLPYPIRAFLIFQYLPNSVNLFIYKLIASKRYKLFGKYEACPLPPANKKQQFLH
ncbi:MAG: DCC1-like thiol-disulfide oxidoreductase family protein [bacterium]|nr:DCC1-like thiol-disulfide oxidoreductase family protein [bacterium]